MMPHILKEDIKFGTLIISGMVESPLPLRKTSVIGQILGPISTVVVSQYFENPTEETLELEYLFPLPHEASIVGFKIQLGNRVINGDLQEIELARKAYAQARDQGYLSGLLEERRPNLFSTPYFHCYYNSLPGA